LTSRVPDLQLDIFLSDLDSARAEFNSNGQVVLLAEALVCELEEETGFTDACVTNDDVLEKVCVGHYLL